MNYFDSTTASPQLVLDDLEKRESRIASMENDLIRKKFIDRPTLEKLYRLAILKNFPISTARDMLGYCIHNPGYVTKCMVDLRKLESAVVPSPRLIGVPVENGKQQRDDERSENSFKSENSEQQSQPFEINSEQERKKPANLVKRKLVEERQENRALKSMGGKSRGEQKIVASAQPVKTSSDRSKPVTGNSIIQNFIEDKRIKKQEKTFKPFKNDQLLSPFSEFEHLLSKGEKLKGPLTKVDLLAHEHLMHALIGDAVLQCSDMLMSLRLTPTSKVLALKMLAKLLYSNYYPLPNLNAQLTLWDKSYTITFNQIPELIERVEKNDIRSDNVKSIMNNLRERPYVDALSSGEMRLAKTLDIPLHYLRLDGNQQKEDSYISDGVITNAVIGLIEQATNTKYEKISELDIPEGNLRRESFAKFVAESIGEGLMETGRNKPVPSCRLSKEQANALRNYLYGCKAIVNERGEPVKASYPNPYAVYKIIKAYADVSNLPKITDPLKETLIGSVVSELPNTNQGSIRSGYVKGYPCIYKPSVLKASHHLFETLKSDPPVFMSSPSFLQTFPRWKAVHPLWEFLTQQTELISMNTQYQWSSLDYSGVERGISPGAICYSSFNDDTLQSPYETRVVGDLSAARTSQYAIAVKSRVAENAGFQPLHANWVQYDTPLILSQQPRTPNKAQWWSAMVKENVGLIIDLTSDEENDDVNTYYTDPQARHHFTETVPAGPDKRLANNANPPSNWIEWSNTEPSVAAESLRLELSEGYIPEDEIDTCMKVELTAHRVAYADGERDGGMTGVGEVDRIQLKNWPDKGIVSPDKLLALVNGIRRYQAESSQQNRNLAQPMVIHCKAGVGRSGVLATALEICNRIDQMPKAQLERTEILNELIYAILQGRRDRGPSFVQTEQQFDLLMYTTLLYAAQRLKQLELND